MRGSVVEESPRDYARNLRRRQTDAERRLWARLRDRRLLDAKFSRQVPIGPYVVDFCCRELKLIVELDGGQHATRAALASRPSPRPSPRRGEGGGEA